MKITINGKKFEGHYETVSVYDLVTSHNEKTLAPNPAFPCKNDRDYTRDKAARDKVIEMSLDFDDRAYRIFPIVKKERGSYFVLSGNNRVMSYKRATRFNGYTEALKQDALYKPSLEKPMKIFVVDDVIEITTKTMSFFNQSDQKDMSTIEKAVSLAKIFDNDSLEKLNNYIDGFETLAEFYASRKCVNLFSYLVEQEILNTMEIGKYCDKTAGITNEGKLFLECLFMGSVFSDTCIRTLSSEGMKTLMNKFVKTSLIFSSNADAGDYSIIPLIEKGIFAIKEAQNAGTPIETFLSQQDFFESPYPVIVGKIIEKILLGQKDFKEFFSKVIDRLNFTNAGNGDLLLGRKETFKEIIEIYFDCEMETEETVETVEIVETVEETPVIEKSRIEKFVMETKIDFNKFQEYKKIEKERALNNFEMEAMELNFRIINYQIRIISDRAFDMIRDIKNGSEQDRLYALYEKWCDEFEQGSIDIEGFVDAFPKDFWKEF